GRPGNKLMLCFNTSDETAKEIDAIENIAKNYENDFEKLRNNQLGKLKLFLEGFNENELAEFFQQLKPKGNLSIVFCDKFRVGALNNTSYNLRLEAVLTRLYEFIDRHPYFEGRADTEKDKQNQVKRLLGLSDNCNAFSNFGNTFLRCLNSDAGVARLKEEYKRQFPGADLEYTNKVLNRLRHSLGNVSWQVNFAGGTGDYRSEIEAKLNSWLSNKLRLQKDLQTALKTSVTVKNGKEKKNTGIIEVLSEKVTPFCKHLLSIPDLHQRHEEIEATLVQCDYTRQLLSDLCDSLKGTPDSVLRDLALQEITFLRSKLNRYLQDFKKWHFEERGEKKKYTIKIENKDIKNIIIDKDTDFKKLFPELSKDLPKIPAFVGEVQLKTYEKAYHSPYYFNTLWNILIEDINKLKKLMPDLKSALPPDRLQALLRCYRIYSSYINSDSSLKDTFWNSFNGIAENEEIWQSPYSRRKVKIIPEERRPFISLQETLQWLQGALNDGREDQCKRLIERFRDNPDDKMLLLIIDAAKTISACMTGILREELERNQQEIEIEVNRELFKADDNRALLVNPYERIIAFADRYDWKLPVIQYQRYVNECISHLKGFSAYLGKLYMTQNYTLQAVNGEHMNLYCSASPVNVSDVSGMRFYANFPKVKLSEQLPLREEIYMWYNANKASPAKKPAKPTGVTSLLVSSRYQTQFLKWALKKPRTKTCSLAIKGSFLILEQTTPLAVDWETGTLVPKEGANDYRIFTAIPFEMTKEKSDATGPSPATTHRYMGVDLGEYVMAYAVIEAQKTASSRMRIRVLERGIVSDKQQKKLADQVRALKRRQRGGSFSAPSTVVADLRESLVGSLRNRFHSIALRYGAKLSYEFQVSYFERAGQRIRKVYQSVKMTDCPENDAQKALSKNIWGSGQNKDRNIAREVSAAFTSQTCSKCGKAAMDLDSLKLNDRVLAALEAKNIQKGDRENVYKLSL
ncbi:MAG: hypothetical protein D6719_03315, partial [Candidatus Dadabacteria bacterium]